MGEVVPVGGRDRLLIHDPANYPPELSRWLGITAPRSTIVSARKDTKSAKVTFWPSREWRKISGTRSLSTKYVAKDLAAIVLLTLQCFNRRFSNGGYMTRIAG